MSKRKTSFRYKSKEQTENNFNYLTKIQLIKLKHNRMFNNKKVKEIRVLKKRHNARQTLHTDCGDSYDT